MTILERLRAMVAAAPPGASLTLPVDWLRDELLSAELVAARGAPASAAAAPDADLTAETIREELGGTRSLSTIRGWFAAGLIPGAYKLNGVDWRCTRGGWEEARRRMRAGTFYSSAPKAAPAEPEKAELGAWRAAAGVAPAKRRPRAGRRRRA